MRILVLSTFDVWPPRDGGQNRYVNIWRNFPPEHEITILAYDFRNLVGERRYRLADHVEVIVPPASADDARHFYHMQAQTGLWLHDVLCLTDYMFSSEFLQSLKSRIDCCDVLVAAHPYLAPLAFPMAQQRVLKIYESYNVEFDIKKDYFRSSDHPQLTTLLKSVENGERFASLQADMVTAVSSVELDRFRQLYNIDDTKLEIVPNGANIQAHDLPSPAERQEAKRYIGSSGSLVGIFLGSSFAANVESYRQGRDILHAAGFTGTMLLVGSINKAPRDDWPEVSFEERWLGFVDSDLKDFLLSISDFALHLIFSGAGTNLKLFDYMSAGVPIISNKFGRRGVDQPGWCFEVESQADARNALNSIAGDSAEVAVYAAKARCIVMEEFDWASVSIKFAKSLASSREYVAG